MIIFSDVISTPSSARIISNVISMPSSAGIVSHVISTPSSARIISYVSSTASSARICSEDISTPSSARMSCTLVHCCQVWQHPSALLPGRVRPGTLLLEMPEVSPIAMVESAARIP